MGLMRFLVGSIIENCSLGALYLLSGTLNWQKYFQRQLTTVCWVTIIDRCSQLWHLIVVLDLMTYQAAHLYYTLLTHHFRYPIPSEKLIFFLCKKYVSCIFESWLSNTSIVYIVETTQEWEAKTWGKCFFG